MREIKYDDTSVDILMTKLDARPRCDVPQGRLEYFHVVQVYGSLMETAHRFGLYEVLWEQEKNGYEYSNQIVDQLEEGLKKLKYDPIRPTEYKKVLPLIDIVATLIKACKKNPWSKLKSPKFTWGNVGSSFPNTLRVGTVHNSLDTK